MVTQLAREFVAPELDPQLAPPESVVTMHAGRLLGSTVLHDRTIIFVLLVIAAAVLAAAAHLFVVLFGVVPALLGVGSQIVRRFSRSLRYSIAATPDGVRVGYGLLSTNNDTIPPGRIHSVEIRQPLLWRPADWWEVRINVASHSDRQEGGRRSSTILPVGSRAEVFKVLELVLPGIVGDGSRELVVAGLARAVAGDGYTGSPRRAAVLRWFSWRRNGFALEPEAVLLRRGAIWRSLIAVPTARMQSVSLRQGPLLRMLRLADVHVHTPADLSILLEWRGFDVDGATDGHLGVGFDEALGALELTPRSDAGVDALITRAGPNGSLLPTEAAPYFRAERYAFSGSQRLDKGYAVLVVTDGAVDLTFVGRRVALQAGDTVLVPYAAGPLELTGSATVLVFRPPALGVAR